MFLSFFLKMVLPKRTAREHFDPTERVCVGLTTGSPEAEGQGWKCSEIKKASPALQDYSSSFPVNYTQESHQSILLEKVSALIICHRELQ